jgi:hypothetical protein
VLPLAELPEHFLFSPLYINGEAQKQLLPLDQSLKLQLKSRHTEMLHFKTCCEQFVAGQHCCSAHNLGMVLKQDGL